MKTHSYHSLAHEQFPDEAGPRCVDTRYGTRSVSIGHRISRSPLVQGLIIVCGVLLAFPSGLWLGLITPKQMSLAACPKPYHTSQPSYATGLGTEKLLPSDLIKLEVREFGGNPYFLENGTEVVQLDPREPVYVGEPSPELDTTWDHLLYGRYFSISESEAMMLWGDDYLQYRDVQQGGFTGGFDVFHSLHCLNELRKKMNPEYYSPTPLHGWIHDMHCINHIRQTLECASPADIIPSLYRPNKGVQYSDARQSHVCRNSKALQWYTRERFDGSLVVPRDALLADGNTV